MRVFFSFIILSFFSLTLRSQEGDTSSVTLVFAGDLMGHDEQINGAWDTSLNAYNYNSVFQYIKPYIERADLAIVNLEVTLAGPPYKGYPQFSSPDAFAVAARDAGFDIFITANNHALDRGQAGFKRTIHVLDSLKILHTGTFLNSESRSSDYPLLLEKNRIRLSLLNYTYGTNGLVISAPFIINRIDTTQIRKDLQKARLANPDFVIVTIHWGVEYERFANQEQKKLAAFILRHGADAIVGSHPHVVQPVELIHSEDSILSHVVVYSLGNFVSNQRAQYKDGGFVFKMNLVKSPSGTRMENIGYLPYWVYRDDKPGKSVFYVLPVNVYEKNGEGIPLKDYDRYKISRFAEDTREHLKNIPESSFYSE